MLYFQFWLAYLYQNFNSGSIHLPYDQAKCYMFEKLLPLFKHLPAPKVSPHSASIINENAIARCVADIILPSLAAIVEKAVLSAMKGANSLTSSECSPNDVDMGTTSKMAMTHTLPDLDEDDCPSTP